MTLGNLKQFQPGVLLSEGESNRVHRVRAAVEVNEWFAAMTAAERGALVAAAYAAALAPEPDVTSSPEVRPEEHRTARRVPDVTPDVTAGRAIRRSMKAGGVPRTDSVRLALSVPYLNVMQRPMMRGLGWKPERYDRVNRMLGEGDTLIADGVNYRTATGSIMDYRTAEALVRLGVLAPA